MATLADCRVSEVVNILKGVYCMVADPGNGPSSSLIRSIPLLEASLCGVFLRIGTPTFCPTLRAALVSLSTELSPE